MTMLLQLYYCVLNPIGIVWGQVMSTIVLLKQRKYIKKKFSIVLGVMAVISEGFKCVCSRWKYLLLVTTALLLLMRWKQNWHISTSEDHAQ